MQNRNTESIPFALPSLGEAEEEAVLRVMRSGWLTTGNEALRFENEFAERVESRFALALNSATAGLHLALEALGVGPGDTVITTPLTFTASAEVVRYLGAEVLFCDIEADGFNLDPEELETVLERAEAEGRRVKAVIPVHIGGEPCDMRRILTLTDARGIPVVEDAAHAFPVRAANGRYCGTAGRAGVYSFYATKTITTGEGGMLVTDDEELAKRVKVMRLHGIDRTVWDRYTAVDASWGYSVVAAGYKYNLTDLAAAIGRVQLRRADAFLARRREIAERYDEAFGKLEGLELPPRGEDHAWHLYILRLTAQAGIDRDALIARLCERGIGTSVHYIPLHIMPYYRELYGLKPEDYPRALAAYERSLSLPIYPAMTEEQLDRVIRAVENSL